MIPNAPGSDRAQRAEEDITAIITTVIETRDHVRWLRQAVRVLLDHAGAQPPPEGDDEQQ